MSTAYVNGFERGLKLVDNSIAALSKITNATGMFRASTLDNSEEYPIPENLFNSCEALINVSEMFASIKFIDAAGYRTYILNDSNANAKTCYYVYRPNNQDNITHNYKLLSSEYAKYCISKSNITNENKDTYYDCKKQMYPILPENIFRN